MAATMNALMLHGPGNINHEKVAKPEASPGSVVVRVLAAPIWDYVSEVLEGSLRFPHAYPLVFGICCVGRIDQVGPDVVALEAGQLVFCDHIVYLSDAPEKRIVLGYHGGHSSEELKFSSSHYKNGCFAEYARFPAENVHMINEQRIAQLGITPSQMCEISSVMSAIGAANAIHIRPGDTVLVMPGTGFFSSSAITAALGLGAANVLVTSRSKDTLDALVAHFGEDGKRITPLVLSGEAMADADVLRSATLDGKGADAYIDFSSPEMVESSHFEAGLRSLKRFGRCCLAGVIPGNLPLPYLTIRANSISVVGSFAQNRQDVELTIRLIEAGNLTLRKDVAGEFGLGDLDKALKLAKEVPGWGQMVVMTP